LLVHVLTPPLFATHNRHAHKNGKREAEGTQRTKHAASNPHHKKGVNKDHTAPPNPPGSSMNQPRTITIYLLFTLVVVPVYGWLPGTASYHQGHRTNTMTRWAADTKGVPDGNPCWEELYDDDCVMENAAAASFIAAKWIKSMPCGEGIQVRLFSYLSCVLGCRPCHGFAATRTYECIFSFSLSVLKGL
jgi:hypothetical protein